MIRAAFDNLPPLIDITIDVSKATVSETGYHEGWILIYQG